MTDTITPAPDTNVRAVQQLLGERSRHGLAKYGTTTERTDLSLRDWLQHQLEELLDGAVYAQAAIAKLDAQHADTPHADDLAVDRFAAALKAKLADARAKGRSGWETCDIEDLSDMLRDHVEKGDPRDVAAFCCFLWNRGAGIQS